MEVFFKVILHRSETASSCDDMIDSDDKTVSEESEVSYDHFLNIMQIKFSFRMRMMKMSHP